MRAYYFTLAKWAIEDLQKKRVKISTITGLNDPFELAACRFPGEEAKMSYLITGQIYF